MKKIFNIHSKRVSMKYNRTIFLLNLPSIGGLISFAIIVLLFYVWNISGTQLPPIILYCILIGSYCCILYSFFVCLIGFITAKILLNAHEKHTYIEIDDIHLVVSKHTQTVFEKGKFKSYKKMWIFDLNDIDEVEYYKKHIIIYGKARYFHENTDFLSYTKTEKGIEFSHWWYDKNGGKEVNIVEVPDFYSYGDRIIKKIMRSSTRIKERTDRRQKFHKKMLYIANNTDRKIGLTDRYTEKERKEIRK